MILLLLFYNLAMSSQVDFLSTSHEIFEALESESSSQMNLAVVQDRIVSKARLSEFNLHAQTSIQGSSYLYSGSFGGSYRFHFNSKWSLRVDYMKFWNKRSKEGTEALRHQLIPVSLKNATESLISAGVEWAPVYGKFVVFNRAFHFDWYLSSGAGQLTLITKKSSPLLQVGSGVVIWWHRFLSTRFEIFQTFYSYEIPNSNNERETETKTNILLSVGFLL